MNNPEEIKKIGYKLINFQDENIDDLISFLEYFPKSGRAPKGKKKEKESIDFLHRMADMYRDYGVVSHNIHATFSYYNTKEAIDDLVDSFTKNKKTEKIVKGRITFKNESAMSEKRFIQNANEIFELLKSLKGFHRAAIEKPIIVQFKKASDMKSKAHYNSLEDEIWIKESAKLDQNERYGHLQYIIIHELGHRVERTHRLPAGFSDYQNYTTDYSKADSLAGSEAFAELFALSHWKEKYPQYQKKIEKFERLMNQHILSKENEMRF